MVKNHARKNDARARQAATGETFPEAMRNSTPSAVKMLKDAKRLPVIHLGNGVHFDMNAEKPNLHITGAFGSGKTWLVNHMVDELVASKAKCKIIIIAGKLEQHANAQKAQSDGSASPDITLLKASHKDDPRVEEALLEEIAAQAKDEKNDKYGDAPLILIVDGINEVSDESTILLQMITKHGAKRGIHTVITSNDGYGDLPVAIRSNGHNAAMGWVGYGQYTSPSHKTARFSIGAPTESDPTITLGSHVLTKELFRSLLIINNERSPEATRSAVAMDLANQVLRKGWYVTVLSDAANEVNWRMTYGKAIQLVTEHAAVILDDLARDRLDMNERTWKDKENEHWKSQHADPKRHLLIVDGYFDKDSNKNEYQLDLAAFVNYMRGSQPSAHIPVVMTSRTAPWFHSLFANAAVIPIKNTTHGVDAVMNDMGVMGLGRRELDLFEGALATFEAPSEEPVIFSIESVVSELRRD